jgi:hypothetical protein
MRALVIALILVVAPIVDAAPPNDDCANATLIASLPFSDTVDTTTATSAPGDPSQCYGGVGTHSVWYRVIENAPGSFRGAGS